MQNLLYAIAALLLILWGLGFFVFNIGSIIHVLLLIIVIGLLLDIIREKEVK